MTLRELAEGARAVHEVYLKSRSPSVDRDWYLLKLSEELGELVRSVLRHRSAPSPALREELEDEVADLLGHLVLFALEHGIDLEAAFQRKWLRFVPSATDTMKGDI